MLPRASQPSLLLRATGVPRSRPLFDHTAGQGRKGAGTAASGPVACHPRQAHRSRGRALAVGPPTPCPTQGDSPTCSLRALRGRCGPDIPPVHVPRALGGRELWPAAKLRSLPEDRQQVSEWKKAAGSCIIHSWPSREAAPSGCHGPAGLRDPRGLPPSCPSFGHLAASSPVEALPSETM